MQDLCVLKHSLVMQSLSLMWGAKKLTLLYPESPVYIKVVVLNISECVQKVIRH